MSGYAGMMDDDEHQIKQYNMESPTGSELYVELPSIQTDSIEQVQGVGHRHFVFEVHKCKLF